MTDSKLEDFQPTEAERDTSGMDKQNAMIDSLGEHQERGYVPLPSNVPDPPRPGSLWNATFSSGTMIGAFMNSTSARKLEAGKPIPTLEEQLNNIPLTHIDRADVYVGRRLEDYPLVTESLDKEQRDRELMANRPLASFAMGMVEQVAVEPINLLPFGAAFKMAKGTSRLAKAIVSSGATGVTAGIAQEGFITQNELSRTAEESSYNILANGLVGSALGGIGQGLTTRGRIKSIEQRQARNALQREVKDVYMDTFQQLTPEGVLTDEAIAKLSPTVQKAMLSTPMNRMVRSEFGFSRWLSNQMYENGYTLNKNLKGEIKEQSVERKTRADYKKLDNTMIKYDNVYYESIGISPGPFKLTREKIAGAGRQTRAAFDSDVWEVLSSEVPSNDGHVNRAASLIRDEVFEPYKQRLVALGLLPEEFELRNATGYVSSIYLKDKIIEEGGRSARGDNTLPGTLHNGFKAIQEQVKAFKESPSFKLATFGIEDAKEKLKGPTLEERKSIDKRITPLNKKIRELERLKTVRAKDELASINDEIKKVSAERKQIQDDIKKTQKEFETQFQDEIKSFKNELAATEKKVSPITADIRALESSKKKTRERRIALQERIKGKKEGSKTYLSIKAELDNLPSITADIDKNIGALKSKRDAIKPNVSDIKADIKRIQKLQKEEAPAIKGMKDQIKERERKAKELNESKKPTKEERDKLSQRVKDIKNDIAALEKSKELPKELKAELEENIKDLEDKLKRDTPPRLLDSKGEFWPILDDEALWGTVEQTVDNMLGDVSGKLVNPILQRVKSGTASPLKHRKLVVDQMDLKPWQSTDIPHIAHSYVRALSPTVHLNEFAVKHGAKDINDFKTQFEEKLTDEFNAKSAGKTGKEAQRLRKMRDDNLNDMNATFELIEGIYGDGPNVMNSSAKKFWNIWMNWMATRLLGFMTMSSFPDAGAQVFKHGYYRFMHDGIMRSTSDMRDISKRDVQGLGYAVNTMLGSRLASYADTGGLTVNPGPFTRGMDMLTKSFGNLSLMNQWNDMMEGIAGHIGINRTLQTVHNVVEGKRVSQKEILRLNKLGLESKHFDTIYDYTKNNKDTDGAIFADWGNWEITNGSQREAMEQFQRSVSKEIDEIVIVPGLGDRPLLARKEFAGAPLGKMLFQFKSFLMASTNRITTVAAQHTKDSETYEGITAMLALGALSYMTTSFVKGKEVDLSFETMARESIDRSGLLGIFGEYKAVTSKLTGVDVPTRYQSRDKIGALLGPSAGAFSDVANMIQSMIEVSTGKKESMTEKDIDKLMRLLPLQNLATSLELPKKLLKGTLAGLGGIETPELDEEMRKLHVSK
jgi:predicted  nucleic acid-binding Zn-ribbon protein